MTSAEPKGIELFHDLHQIPPVLGVRTKGR